MHSLRWRLIITTAAATALILGLCGIILDARIRAMLTNEFDDSLERNAEAIKPLIFQKGLSIILDPQLNAMPEFTTPARPEYFEVRDLNTGAHKGSQQLGSATLNLPSTRFNSESQALALPDGRPGRVVSIRFKPDERHFNRDDNLEDSVEQKPHVLVLIVARDTFDLQKTLTNLRWLLLIV